MRKQEKIFLSILILIVALYSFFTREQTLQNVKKLLPILVASDSGTFVINVVDGDTIEVTTAEKKKKFVYLV